MDLDSKYIQAISNIDIYLAGNLKLISIKKYQRLVSQIKKKVDGLYRNQILAFTIFAKHSWKINNNEKVTENMKIK